MTQVQPGWFPDPNPQAPAGAQRYWDGVQWTEHVHVSLPALTERDATPDGVRLAGWWQRVGAYVLDGLITVTLGLILSAPFLGELADAVGDYWTASMDAARAGVRGPSQASMYEGHVGAFVGYSLIAITVVFAYNALFLRMRGATLGMRALGIAVRRHQEPGQMPWSTVLKRVFAQFLPSVVGAFPFPGSLAGLYVLVDDLWPLWDRRRQTLHDKVAGTVVVRTR